LLGNTKSPIKVSNHEFEIRPHFFPQLHKAIQMRYRIGRNLVLARVDVSRPILKRVRTSRMLIVYATSDKNEL
jgi:hypothetical protein